MTGETWRTVPSAPSIMVSDEGRIMVTPYQAEMPRGGRRWYGGCPTWGVWNKQDGRFTYQIKGKTYKVHRLICEAFNGTPPNGSSVAMHDDENAANNRASNLSWGTQKENLNAPGFIEYCKSRTGENSPTIKAKNRRGGLSQGPL